MFDFVKKLFFRIACALGAIVATAGIIYLVALIQTYRPDDTFFISDEEGTILVGKFRFVKVTDFSSAIIRDEDYRRGRYSYFIPPGANLSSIGRDFARGFYNGDVTLDKQKAERVYFLIYRDGSTQFFRNSRMWLEDVVESVDFGKLTSISNERKNLSDRQKKGTLLPSDPPVFRDSRTNEGYAFILFEKLRFGGETGRFDILRRVSEFASEPLTYDGTHITTISKDSITGGWEWTEYAPTAVPNVNFYFELKKDGEFLYYRDKNRAIKVDKRILNEPL